MALDIISAQEPVRLSTELRSVSTAIDDAISAPMLSLDDDEILAGLAQSVELRNKLDALAEKLAVTAERSLAVMRAGARDAAIWAGANTSAPASVVRADVRFARWLDRFPEFAAAHERGVLGRDHLRLLKHADTSITHLALIREASPT